MKEAKSNLILSFFIIVVLIMFLASSSEAALQCEARSGSCSAGYTRLFELQSNDNAHASTDNSYHIKICCIEDSGSGISLSASCSGTNDIMLRLSGTSNAHAEKDGQGTPGYTNRCLGSSDGRVSSIQCNYAAGSCAVDYECIARISGDTNAHLSSCSASNNFDRVCCKLDTDVGDPTTDINPDGRGWGITDVGFTLTCDDDNPPCQATYYEIINDGASCDPAGSPAYSSGTSGTVTCSLNNVCEKRVCMYSVDSSGNTETPHASNVFQIDKQNPSTTETHPGTPLSGWYRSNVGVTLTCSDGSGSGCTGGLAQTLYCTTSSSCTPATIGTSFQISNEGTNYFRYHSRDRVGNQEPVRGPVTVRIDSIPPDTTATPSGTPGAGGWYISPVSVTLTCNDPGGDVSGCDQTWYCNDTSNSCSPNIEYTGSFDISGEGLNYVRFMSSDNAENVEFPEGSISFQIDMNPPDSWVDPLPAWTTLNFFDVSWNGDDGGGSGIDFFDIQYRIEERTGSVVQPWTAWISPMNPGTQPFGPANDNNRTYLFRIKATDLAGQTEVFSGPPYSNTTMDLVAPVTSIDDPGTYQTTDDFPLTINGLEGESGMARFNCEAKPPGFGWGPISGVCDEPAENMESVTITCYSGIDGTYEFRCNGTDIAGNTGGYSQVSTIVDRTPPTVHITEPTFEWTKENQFTVSWQGSVDVTSYDVYYNSTPGGPEWQHCNNFLPAETSMTFGTECSPSFNTLDEGQTYYINVTATDIAGLQESDVVYVTIDKTPPAIDINVTDQTGKEIIQEWIPPGSGITFVNITSRAYDSLSGVRNNTIIYVVHGEGGTPPGTYFLECGGGPSAGYSRCSTGLANPYGDNHIEYDDTTSVRYKVETRDRAGNLNETRWFFTVAHPLANFGSSYYYIILGETKLVPVLVRNIQEAPDDITLNLTSSNYQFAWFEYLCEPGECVIGGDKKNMDVLNVNPYEERTYYVRLLSSEPGEYALHLNATSAIDPTLEDNHTLTLEMGYPIYFPGMGPFSIVLLVILAGLIFGWVSRENS
jgi:hypothetical protein